MEEYLLEAQGILRSFSTAKVLEDTNLKIRKGEIHALLGENGVGKLTLTEILIGVLEADKGMILYRGKPLKIVHPRETHEYGIGIVYQELNLLPDLTVTENIFIGCGPQMFLKGFTNDSRLNEGVAQFLERLNCSSTSPTRRVGTLSVAEQQVVEITKTLSSNCELFIMDEPTAALTDSEIGILFNIVRKLKHEGVVIIYMSHRISDLDAIVDRVMVLRDGKLISRHGYDSSIKDLLIQEMVGRELIQKFPLRPDYKRGKKTLGVKGLSIASTLYDINFDTYEEEILDIAGLMEAGRTELARAIFGADKIDSGEIRINGTVKHITSPYRAISEGVGCITEDRKKDGLMLEQILCGNISVASLDKFCKGGFVKNGLVDEAVEQHIRKMRIKTGGMDQLVKVSSGGNQRKVVVAKRPCRESKILILDEFIRGIDVDARYEIYELTHQPILQGVIIIMIPSELSEVIGVGDWVLVMCEGRMIGGLGRKELEQDKVLKYAMAR